MKNIFITLITIISLSISLKAQFTFKANLEKSKFSWTGYASVGNYAPTGTIQLSTGSLNFNGKLKPSKPASYSVDADFNHCHSDSKE